MKKQAKHTEGPWSPSSDGGWDCVRDSEGQVICKLGLNEPANMPLIAAAPDLLYALEGMCQALTSVRLIMTDKESRDYAGELVAAAEKIIARATP